MMSHSTQVPVAGSGAAAAESVAIA
jgi:hypothetical protein